MNLDNTSQSNPKQVDKHADMRSLSQSQENLISLKNDWLYAEIKAIYDLPMNDLLFKAQTIHRQNFNPNEVQTSTLMSIKTGACPEDCAYCPQSGHYNTGLSKEQLVALDDVVRAANKAKQAGATRFCMGAAWRTPRGKDFPVVLEMVKEVKRLGMETCVTLGMLDNDQAHQLKSAGLDYYNHNLDTSEEYYDQIITTRTFADRLDTLSHVRDAGMKVCAGGILGMGETIKDRLGLLQALANLPEHPQSVPINQLIAVKGTPLQDAKAIEGLEFIRMIAVARIMMPKSYVRLSAGRENMSDEMQAMCFLAGANSVFYGDKLLTTDNPDIDHDTRLFARLGITPEEGKHPSCSDESDFSEKLDFSEKSGFSEELESSKKPLYTNAAL